MAPRILATTAAPASRQVLPARLAGRKRRADALNEAAAEAAAEAEIDAAINAGDSEPQDEAEDSGSESDGGEAADDGHDSASDGSDGDANANVNSSASASAKAPLHGKQRRVDGLPNVVSRKAVVEALHKAYATVIEAAGIKDVRSVSATRDAVSAVKQMTMDALNHVLCLSARVMFHAGQVTLTESHVARALLLYGLLTPSGAGVSAVAIKPTPLTRHVRAHLVDAQKLARNAPKGGIHISERAIEALTKLIGGLVSAFALGAAEWTRVAKRATVTLGDVEMALTCIRDGFQHTLPTRFQLPKAKRARKAPAAIPEGAFGPEAQPAAQPEAAPAAVAAV